MIKSIKRIEYVKVTKYIQTEEDFERATGNKCKDFRPNRMTNEVI